MEKITVQLSIRNEAGESVRAPCPAFQITRNLCVHRPMGRSLIPSTKSWTVSLTEAGLRVAPGGDFTTRKAAAAYAQWLQGLVGEVSGNLERGFVDAVRDAAERHKVHLGLFLRRWQEFPAA